MSEPWQVQDECPRCGAHYEPCDCLAGPPARTPYSSITELCREIGTAVRAYREANEVTVRQVATRAGMLPTTIEAVEAGREVPSTTLVRVCDAVGMRLRPTVGGGV